MDAIKVTADKTGVALDEMGGDTEHGDTPRPLPTAILPPDQPVARVPHKHGSVVRTVQARTAVDLGTQQRVGLHQRPRLPLHHGDMR